MAEYALELSGVCKSFGGVPVLKNVDFRLRKGSICALVGGNGAGKSTLMKILTGIYTKDSGRLRVNGEEVIIRNYNEAKKYGISLIFQELGLIPTLTVAENIFLNKELRRGKFLDDKRMEEKAEKLLESLGLEVNVREKVENLSVGTCQLIEIAKALSDNTSILVMDEPTASLSDKETEILFRIVEDLKQRGISIVYISHRMKEIFRIADDITVLYGGETVAAKPVEEYTLESVIDYMLGGKQNEQLMTWKDRTAPIGKELALKVENLCVENLVKDVSFEVHQGEVVGLAGLMGSGRTEILECIFGLRRKTGGRIFLEGKEVNFRNVREAVRARVALVPEDRRREGLVLSHTLRDNMVVTNFEQVRAAGVLSAKKSNAVSEKAIRDLKIRAESANTRMVNLSGGNQQKVVIAKWMNINPKLIMMDEPTAGVDIHAKSEIIELIRGFVSQGHSVIFVSSELSEMMAVCDRIIILHDGRKTGELTHKEINSEEVLQRAIQI